MVRDMTVKKDVPNYNRLIAKALDETKTRVMIEIENKAKLVAPVDTGFLRNSIKPDFSSDEVVANAEYSAPVEYGVGGTKRIPNPFMRNSARAVQGDVTNIFKRIFRRV